MKKIIDGKKYDTATADLLYEYDNGLIRGDFDWACEALYRTVNGNYFLHGKGGPRSEWAEQIGTARYSGERIRPLSSKLALEWLEKYGEVEVIEKYFTIEDA